MPRAVDAEGTRRIEPGVDVETDCEQGRETAGESSARAENGGGAVPDGGATEVPLRGLTDLELLEGLRDRSERHFNELYNRYFQRIYSFVYTRMRNHADAEEVVQETFTAVYRSFESYRGTSSLLSWIYGIAKNTLNNSLRRSKTEDQHLDAIRPEMLRRLPALADCNPEEHLSLVRYTEAISDRLETVTEWQSEIFAMRHLENMSIQEISNRTHRSSDAVRSSLYRVKRLLFETADLLPSSERLDAGAEAGGEMTARTGGEACDVVEGVGSLRGAEKS